MISNSTIIKNITLTFSINYIKKIMKNIYNTTLANPINPINNIHIFI